MIIIVAVRGMVVMVRGDNHGDVRGESDGGEMVVVMIMRVLLVINTEHA